MNIPELTAERDRLKAILSNLMPFVLEDYFPDCATPEFKSAVEAAKAVTSRYTVDGHGDAHELP